MKSDQIRSYFWSVISCIQYDYRRIRTRNNSVFGHFSRNGFIFPTIKLAAILFFVWTLCFAYEFIRQSEKHTNNKHMHLKTNEFININLNLSYSPNSSRFQMFFKMFFIKLQNFTTKRLQHRCFPVKFAKFLRTSFFTEHLWMTASFSHFTTSPNMEMKESHRQIFWY